MTLMKRCASLGLVAIGLVLAAAPAVAAPAKAAVKGSSLKSVVLVVPADAKARAAARKPAAPVDPEREIWRHHGVG